MARRYPPERAALQCSYTPTVPKTLLHLLLAFLHPRGIPSKLPSSSIKTYLTQNTPCTNCSTHSKYVHSFLSYYSGGDPMYRWSYEIAFELGVLLMPNFTVNNDSHIPAPPYAIYQQHKIGRGATTGISTNKRRSQQPSRAYDNLCEIGVSSSLLLLRGCYLLVYNQATNMGSQT